MDRQGKYFVSRGELAFVFEDVLIKKQTQILQPKVLPINSINPTPQPSPLTVTCTGRVRGSICVSVSL